MTFESRAALSSRRSFLKAVGSVATALPFYKMLENNVALAQTGQLPLKFLGLGFYHTTAPKLYSRQAGETSTQFSLTYPDSPFKPFDDAATYGESFKSRLSIFEGFDLGVGEYNAQGAAAHVPLHGAMGLLLTGSSPVDANNLQKLQNESLDQYLANRYGSDTRFRSVQMRGYDQLGYPLDSAWVLSFGVGGVPLNPLDAPLEIWNKYFRDSIVPSDAAAKAEAERKRAIGASVLDFVVKDISRLNVRLASAERQKLDQHLSVIRGLEKRLVAPPASAPICSPPGQPLKAFGQDWYKFTDGHVELATELQMEMLAELIACGLTRFATYLMPQQIGVGAPAVPMTNRYTGGSTFAADGTDKSGYPIYANFHDDCAHMLSDGNAELDLHSQRMLAAVNRYYFSKIARLMRRLSQAGVLDSTVIMIGSDGGHGAGHSTQCDPIMLAGGANGKLALGKRIVAPGRTAQIRQYPTGAALTSHNPILVAVANLFGANIDRYGTCSQTQFTHGVSSLLG